MSELSRRLQALQALLDEREAEPLSAAEAKKRMSAGGGDKKSGVERLPHPIENQGKARDQAAAVPAFHDQVDIDPDNLPYPYCGMGHRQLQLLAADGDEIAEEILSYKSIPEADGYPPWPNIKLIERRKRYENKSPA